MRFRDVGAAYRANDAKGVAASVLWIQGSTIDPPAFAPAILKGRKDGLAYLAEAQSSLSIELLREESLRAGGRVTQSAVENSKRPWVAVSFGLGAPIRAQKLARSLAQRAKLGGAR